MPSHDQIVKAEIIKGSYENIYISKSLLIIKILNKTFFFSIINSGTNWLLLH